MARRSVTPPSPHQWPEGAYQGVAQGVALKRDKPQSSETRGMTTEIDVERPAATLSGTAPVAMQRARHSDRIPLAGLRAERRWLVRDRDNAAKWTARVTQTRRGERFRARCAKRSGRRRSASTLSVPAPARAVPGRVPSRVADLVARF
jgi:hypothetical protein